MAENQETILVKIKSMLMGDGFSKANSMAQGLSKTIAGLGLSAAGAKFASLAKDSVNAAVTAEQEWNRFGNVINNTGGNWEQQSDEVKQWVRDYSNSMGRAVSDTRSAMTTFMNMGMSLDDSKQAMQATSNLAAQMGMSQEEAAGALQKAFMGNGRYIKQLGLDIKNYKDETTGAIDKQKLMNDILARTGGAADKYANSTAGKMQRVQNQIAMLKTEFGSFIVDALTPFIPVAEGILKFLNNMPAPAKSAAMGIVALAGGFLMLAGPITTAIGALETFGGLLGGLGKASGGGGIAGGGAAGGASKGAGQGIVSFLQGIKGFGSALLGLVPDILMAAAAVAVIIAVVAALAAEVIVLVKGIQMLIDAMDFNGIDLNDDIEGLKKLQEAMWQIASIMGAMTVANVANIATQVTGGVLNLAVSLATIKDAYKKVADAMAELKNLGDIDQGGLDKLKKLAEAMKALGEAATGLQEVNNSMNTSQAINDFVAWLTGGESDITANIDTLIQKINEIAPKLNSLTSLPDIDQSGVDKIRAVGDALKAIGDAATSMQGIQGGAIGSIMDWLQGSLQDQIDKAIQVIQDIAPKLQGLAGINVPDLTGVQRVAVGLSYLKSAADQLVTFSGFEVPEDVPERVGRAVDMVKQVATQLQGLGGTNIGDVATILTQIQTAVQQIKDTLAAANFTQEGINIGMSLVTGVQQGLAGMTAAVSDGSNQAVQAAQGILPPGLASAASTASQSFRDNFKLGEAAAAEMNYAVQAVQNGSGALASAAAEAARKAYEAAKNANHSGSPGDIARLFGNEIGTFAPYLINKNSPALYSAIGQAASRAATAFGTPTLSTEVATAFTSPESLNTEYTPTGNANTGSVAYYIQKGAFEIVVKDMTRKEAQGVIIEALETL